MGAAMRPAAAVRLAALLVAALVLQARPGHAKKTKKGAQLLATTCSGEWQLVMCGDIPISDVKRLEQCCELHKQRPTPGSAAGTLPANATDTGGSGDGVDGRPASALWNATLTRVDLAGGPFAAYSAPPDYLLGTCTYMNGADVPAFSRDANNATQALIISQPVPALSPDLIADVKRRAMAAAPPALRRAFKALTRHSPTSARKGAFVHPGSFVGAAELAAMQTALTAGEDIRVAAKHSLLTGQGVPAKVYPSGWSFRTDAPSEGYEGPMALAAVEMDWGGAQGENHTCPDNYPAGAPTNVCGHVAFVEIDSQMAYKQALAYLTTSDERHARLAVSIIKAWATTNTKFGLKHRNGPLEAAWGCASMSRAMELLRYSWPEFSQAQLTPYLRWVDTTLMPLMDFYVDVITPTALGNGRRNLYGNWHASVADCMMAHGVLSDNRARYTKGVDLYRRTVGEYFKWGRGVDADGRIVGEATETLRDIYHTQFGLGSLLQAAETAWAQGTDEYRANDYAMAAAMELHARIINARDADDESMLPPGFRFFDSMPDAPANCSWRFDIESQSWSSFDSATGEKCSDLTDGLKYVVGIKHLATGWELGYNHYVGRLGMSMPETAAMLARYPVDWVEFSWGGQTLTHANTATQLWRPGLKHNVLCRGGRRYGGQQGAAVAS